MKLLLERKKKCECKSGSNNVMHHQNVVGSKYVHYIAMLAKIYEDMKNMYLLSYLQRIRAVK